MVGEFVSDWVWCVCGVWVVIIGHVATFGYFGLGVWWFGRRGLMLVLTAVVWVVVGLRVFVVSVGSRWFGCL